MAHRAQRPKQPHRAKRIEHPINVRAWVIPLDSEDIHRELLARLAALDDSVVSSRDLILKLEHSVTERALRQLGLETMIPKVASLLDDPAGAPRVQAMMTVVKYFADHPYKRGVFLPRISVGGDPAGPPPDMIHVLDIPSDRIREATAALLPDPRVLEAMIHRVSQSPSDDHDVLTALGLQAIAIQGLAAIFNPMLHAALFVNLVKAHYASSVDEARAAADSAIGLFDTFLPDLSQHMSRRPDQLMEMQTKWHEYKEKSQDMLQILFAHAESGLARKVTRGLFGRLVTLKDLQRWHRDKADAETVASELMMRERGISRKTLGDYRRLWGQTEGIDEAWRHFAEYFAKLPREEQRRLVPLAQAPDPPSHSSSEHPPGD